MGICNCVNPTPYCTACNPGWVSPNLPYYPPPDSWDWYPCPCCGGSGGRSMPRWQPWTNPFVIITSTDTNTDPPPLDINQEPW